MISSRDFPLRSATRTRVAVATVFFVNGAVLASGVPHIPAVQMKLGLGLAVLGFALLRMAETLTLPGALGIVVLSLAWIAVSARHIGGTTA